MKTLVLALFAAATAGAASVAATLTAPPSYRVEEAPARLLPGLTAADAAIDALQRRLSARLQAALADGGPPRAVSVCRDEAAVLAAEVARERGVRLGRTSHRLRNPGNAPPAWAEERVRAAAGGKAAEVEAGVFDLGDRVGVLRPIAVSASCLRCHGPSAGLSPEVAAVLASAYPGDQAAGFREGDLRGFFWAEAPVDAAAATTGDTVTGGGPVAGARLLEEANPRCTLCHSVAGKGNRRGPRLDGVGARLPPDAIRGWIRDPARMAKARGTTRKPAMVPYPEFTDEELDALVAYLSSLEAVP